MKRNSFINIFVLILFIILTLQVNFRYYSLLSNIADLGFYVNNISNVIENPAIIFTGHISPFLYIFGLIFKLFPFLSKSFFLINFQLFVLALTIGILYKHFNNISALILLLFFPTWTTILFDFHIDILLLPIMLCMYITIRSQNSILIFTLGCLLCLIKEPYSLVAAGFGVFILIESKYSQINSNKIIGLLLILLGFSYFFCVSFILLPIFNDSAMGAMSGSAFNWLFSISDHIYSFQFNLLFWEMIYKKILLLLILFGSTGFASLIYIRYLIPGLPVLGISLLSATTEYYDYSNHYMIAMSIPVILSIHYFFYNFTKIHYLNKFILVFTPLLVTFMYLGYSPIGRLFWVDKIHEYSYKSYLNFNRTSIIRRALNHYLEDKIYSISSQNNIHLDIISDRKSMNIFPKAVPILNLNKYYGETSIASDLIVLDLKKPLFIYANGCNWIYGSCTNKSFINKFDSILDAVNLNYYILFEYDGFLIYKRRIC